MAARPAAQRDRLTDMLLLNWAIITIFSATPVSAVTFPQVLELAGKALRGQMTQRSNNNAVNVGSAVTTPLSLTGTTEATTTTRRDRQLREAGGEEFVDMVWRRHLADRGRWARTSGQRRRWRQYIALDCRRGRLRCRKAQAAGVVSNLRSDLFVRVIGQSWHLFRVVRTIGDINRRSRSCKDALNAVAGGNFEDQLTLARYAYEKGNSRAAYNILVKAVRNGKVCSVVMPPNTAAFQHLQLANKHLQDAIQSLFLDEGSGRENIPIPIVPSPPPSSPPSSPKVGGGGGRVDANRGQTFTMQHEGRTTDSFIIDYSPHQIWDKTEAAPSNEIIITCQLPYKGARFRSKYHYEEGVFSARIKAASGNTDGIVTSFYTSSLEGDKTMDEIDFEFLGKDQTIIQTNFFVNGYGHREQIVRLGFDAGDDFHEYTLDIKKDSITWLIDGRVVRVAKKEDHPDGFPKKKFYLYASMWDATMVMGGAWAGQSTFSDQPYYTTYRDIRLPVNHANCPGDPEPANSCGQ